MGLRDVYKIFHPCKRIHIFLNAHKTFYRRDHTLVTKQVLTNFKLLKLFLVPLSNHNGMKLEVIN